MVTITMVTITLVTITLVTITLVTDLPSLFIGTEIKEPITSLVRSYQLRLINFFSTYMLSVPSQ